MFFQWLIGFLVLLGGAWALWKFVIKDALESSGIEVEPEPEPEDIKTAYTKKLDRLKNEFKELSVSSKAGEEALELSKQIKEMEDMLVDIDKRMKDV